MRACSSVVLFCETIDVKHTSATGLVILLGYVLVQTLRHASHIFQYELNVFSRKSTYSWKSARPQPIEIPAMASPSAPTIATRAARVNALPAGRAVAASLACGMGRARADGDE
eukprot:6711678-Prymnesium_polylepis.1